MWFVNNALMQVLYYRNRKHCYFFLSLSELLSMFLETNRANVGRGIFVEDYNGFQN